MKQPRQPGPKFPVCKDLRLRLSRNLSATERERIFSATSGLPALTGSPLFVKALPQLTAHRGRLLSAKLDCGTPVHAASFIRRREIVLESELLNKAELPMILVHEIFHFVWVRLGNVKRAGYAALLAEEIRAHARGELGESASVKKKAAPDTRDYICESFCDTAAWLYAPGEKRANVTLAKRWQARRKAWFDMVTEYTL